MSSEIANVEQTAAWQGEEEHWVAHEARYDAAVRRYDGPLFDAARVVAADRVLDVGCGCGATTREAARAAARGMALGVDLSARMIARARSRARAEGPTNARFEQADAQVYPFDAQSFDLAISRFGAMFFGDSVAAFGNVGRALRPGGRLALLAWQRLANNEWLVALRGALAAGRTLSTPPLGAPGPFGLADPAAVRRILAGAGYEAIAVESVSEPLYFGADTDDAFGFLRGQGAVRGMLGGLDAPTAARALAALRATLAAQATAGGVLLGSAAWLITARRPT
ncbi:MAG TPA: class I SAM-dependent methyltransferase [Chloroflexota bacterium]|jgi:SAM-dependent methyltransferase